MATIFDVAAYILEKRGGMTAMKLQKLCYYSQAWSLVWDERPLFSEEIQAWANGPVSPDLYREHRGQIHIAKVPKGDHAVLIADERETVDAVLGCYGDMSAHELSELTHREHPWKKARGDLKPGERGNQVISHDSMFMYYDSLCPEDDDT